MKKTHDNWTSRLGFILSAAGSAIGLGAIRERGRARTRRRTGRG